MDNNSVRFSYTVRGKTIFKLVHFKLKNNKIGNGSVIYTVVVIMVVMIKYTYLMYMLIRPLLRLSTGVQMAQGNITTWLVGNV